ncbi:MAG: hypothetical protein ABSG81_11480 [Acidimicrobiales bacterium]|jgi:hypothetical protein
MTHDTDRDVPAPQRVELAFPPRPDLVFLARMTAAAVATRADFGFDQVEDLRLAIDELCITVAGEGGAEGQLRLLFEWADGTIRVDAALETDGAGPDGPGADGGSPPASASAGDLSERILDALVDEHGTDSATGTRRAWIVVRRTAPT